MLLIRQVESRAICLVNSNFKTAISIPKATLTALGLHYGQGAPNPFENQTDPFFAKYAPTRFPLQTNCSRCGGSGTTPWTHIMDGQCFKCNGSGISKHLQLDQFHSEYWMQKFLSYVLNQQCSCKTPEQVDSYDCPKQYHSFRIHKKGNAIKQEMAICSKDNRKKTGYFRLTLLAEHDVPKMISEASRLGYNVEREYLLFGVKKKIKLTIYPPKNPNFDQYSHIKSLILKAKLSHKNRETLTSAAITAGLLAGGVVAVATAAVVKGVAAIRDKAKSEAGEVWNSQIGEILFPLVYCPAGRFKMGSLHRFGWGSKRQHQPIHNVEITKAFLIGQTPVTQSLWQVVMQNTINPSHFKGPSLPVEQVSWFDCVKFCNILSEAEKLDPVYQIGVGLKPTVNIDLSRNGYRLPTEAEWEYMAKAGQDEYDYSGSNLIDEVAWYSKNSQMGTENVGKKKANAWGIHDCSGNIHEWCNDIWHESSYQARTTGIVRSTSILKDPHQWSNESSPRVARGGSWRNGTENCRVATRHWHDADKRENHVGFRIVRVF